MDYPYKNHSVSGSEKPLLVLPRRKSKKLELEHSPPPQMRTDPPKSRMTGPERTSSTRSGGHRITAIIIG